MAPSHGSEGAVEAQESPKPTHEANAKIQSKREGERSACSSVVPESRRQHERREATEKVWPQMTKAHARRKPLKDPAGGLTAAGRADFAKRQGSHLRPGVKKAEREMTVTEMKRKGSWARRFYGRDKLPPLVDARGRPTRFAKTAAAWGEPVPKTVAAARRIAAKGTRLLERAERAQRTTGTKRKKSRRTSTT
jgi:hypothetical protein